MKRLLSFLILVVTLVLTVVIDARAEVLPNDAYYSVSLTSLTFRDEKGTNIGTVPENEILTVLGVDPRDSKRDWVLWNGKKGSVIRTGTASLGFSVLEYAKNAIVKTELNMRIPENYEIITTIPQGAEVTVLYEDKYHNERWVVDYQGIVGSVIKNGLLIYGETDLIIVDIENQTVRMIKDGRIWIYSKVVTGLEGSRDTPKGLYSIKSMERNATLKGADYSTNVKYWMPFYKGYGLHDAKWRSEFGGGIYKTNGSHGCVNMPEHVAKAMFENAYVGYLVMVI